MDYGRATPDPPPEREPEEPEPPVVQEPMVHAHHVSAAPSLTSSPSALFKRLRNASFSPFASIRQRSSRSLNPNANGGHDQMDRDRGQSSESSSDDDDLSILSRRVWAPSTVRDDSDEQDHERDGEEDMYAYPFARGVGHDS